MLAKQHVNSRMDINNIVMTLPMNVGQLQVGTRVTWGIVTISPWLKKALDCAMRRLESKSLCCKCAPKTRSSCDQLARPPYNKQSKY